MYLVRLITLIILGLGGFYFAGSVDNQNLRFISMMAGCLAVILFYFYPMYEAHFRKQPNFDAIFMVNLLLGWTLIGWTVALIWALREPEIVAVVNKSKTDVAESHKASDAAKVHEATKQMVECPFCAEDILAKARKCKHCGSEVEPAIH
ncbi:superinfection immunity protein [Shewanella insulae]|uniref:superinfection immunity protein n=1 Tax=Shewanella insulae TaxID=2681496 RepID=UPI001EFD9E65|nr:superinfection immunity protein [Shewanella insulae]MCG9740172.1 superinfection immunity protein [Shewanella insulae]